MLPNTLLVDVLACIRIRFDLMETFSTVW